MKVLVFGASGFIGKTLIKYLIENGHEATGVYRSLPSGTDLLGGVEILESSSQADKIFERINADLAINVSNFFSRTAESADIEKFADVNAVLISAICKGCISSDTALIQVGSAWEANFSADDPSLGNTYALFKGLASQICNWYQDSFGLKFAQLNLFDTYGEGDTRGKIVQFLTEQIGESNALDLSGGMQILELVHVIDVASCVTRLGNLLINDELPDSKIKYACFPNKPVTLRQLVETIDQISIEKVAVNWGAREYRVGEMFKRNLREFRPVPGWEQEVDIYSGLCRVINS